MDDGQLVAIPAERCARGEASGSYMLCQMLTARSGQPRYNGESYVDLLDAQVTEAFLQCTNEAYKARFGHLFGPNAPGIFTDEPNISPISGGFPTPWTTLLPQRFRELWGYDIEDRLPELFTRRRKRTSTTRLLGHPHHPFPRQLLNPTARCEANGIQMTARERRPSGGAGDSIGACMRTIRIYNCLGSIIWVSTSRNPETGGGVAIKGRRGCCKNLRHRWHSMTFADQSGLPISTSHWYYVLNQHLTLYSMMGERNVITGKHQPSATLLGRLSHV